MGNNKILASQTNFGDGWIPAKETWAYSSVDDPTGVITVPTDATTKYSLGMRISFVNGGNTIYGIITAVTSTTITFLHEIDPTDSQALHLMANSAITVPKYSTQKAPFGFPLSPTKWSIIVNDTSSPTQDNPTQNIWYNLGSINIVAPIGEWVSSYRTCAFIRDSGTNGYLMQITLSTANNSESESLNTTEIYLVVGIKTGDNDYGGMLSSERFLTVTSKTSYYLNARTTTAGITRIRFKASGSNTILRFVCAYL